ncbi:MAG: hypothetical protein KDK78_10235 [Chlamydiia bacterium]|nr:hypothetical protein [Chlamydiia bacterium]
MPADAHSHLDPLVCLPFVEVQNAEAITIGPVTFWPSSLFAQYLEPAYHQRFADYMLAVRSETESEEGILCASIDSDIPAANCYACLVDAIIALYFVAYYQDIYYNLAVPRFQIFAKSIPIDRGFLASAWSCPECNLLSKQQRQPAVLQRLDACMAAALGNALSLTHIPPDESSSLVHVALAQRILRSARFFVNSFSCSFESLFTQGQRFPKSLFDSEDILFLSTAFEVLLSLDPNHLTSDFKFKTRGAINMQYSTPIECFWKWVDGFFRLKQCLVHQGKCGSSTFVVNPSFEVSYAHIATRLFVFILCNTLLQEGFMREGSGRLSDESLEDPIKREELLVFFWSEEQLLQTIEANLANWKDPGLFCIDHKIGLGLIQIYCTLIKRYKHPTIAMESYAELHFRRTPESQLRGIKERILAYRSVRIQTLEGERSIEAATPALFWKELSARSES